MKQYFAFRQISLLALLCLPLLVGAQGSQNQGIQLSIKSNGVTATYEENQCSYLGAPDWGGTVESELCAPIEWVKDLVDNDSVGCDSIEAGRYAGKIALVRRGTCEFGVKALRAERGGAIAVLIVNHFSNAAETGCTQFNMLPGAVGAQVTIPAFFVTRDLGKVLDEAVKSGNASVCLSLPRFYNASAPYHYATPVSQADSLGAITVRYVNRDIDPEQDVELKVTFNAPDGSSETMTVKMAEVLPAQDTFVVFPVYKPKAVPGKHTAVFTNNKHNDTRDTLRRNFYYTQYTYATDNLVIDPLGVGYANNQDFIDAGLFIQNASLYYTNSQSAKATHATFGLANVDSLYAPGDPTANQIIVTLYDADVDGDGEPNLSSSFDELSDGIVGQTTYTMTGNEPVDSLLNVEIYDYNDPNKIGVDLKPNHAYYLSLAYDGNSAGTGRCPRYSNTLDEYYLGGFFATPLFSGGTLYNSGWQGAEVIQRLRLEGYNPAVSNEPFEKTTSVGGVLLDPSKIEVTPNPANEFIRVNLRLQEQNPTVGFTLLDGRGRVVRTSTQRNVQDGTFQIESKDLPSGAYLLWVRTAEGGRTVKVMVCH